MALFLGDASLLKVVTSTAANIEVHASVVDIVGSTVTPQPPINPAAITTATTTTVVGSPAATGVRNVKHLNITNTHASASCRVVVDLDNGTTTAELMGFTLLSGENMILNEEGRWAHRDSQGAEYPPAGKGAFDGYSISFAKSGTPPDAAGYWYGTWKDSGSQGAWSPGTPGVNGRITDGTSAADAGCIPIKNPGTGVNYLTEMTMASTIAHANMFFDVLWVNSGLVITTTTAQAIVTPTLPPRDVNGATAGEGCMIGIMCTAAIGLAAISNAATVSYTNSAGVAGRTATLSALIGSQVPATPVIGTIIWFNLAAGDKGVRSIESITLGITWTSGTISLFIARDLAMIGTVQPYIATPKSLSEPGIRLFNNTCGLHCIQASAATATYFNGELVIQEK